MIIVHHALKFGGIETFYLRLAQHLNTNGKKLKIILFNEIENDLQLYENFTKYAEIISFKSICLFPSKFNRLFTGSTPLNKKKIKELTSSESVIYTSNLQSLAIALRINQISGFRLKPIIGFHHSKEFTWEPQMTKLGLHEKIGRKILYTKIPKKNLLLFNHNTRSKVELYSGQNLSKSQIFPLGVVSSVKTTIKSKTKSTLKICSVGRLVDFKSYNLWMLDVVSNLNLRGTHVTYDIYGEGPLKKDMINKIKTLKLNDFVTLKGNFSYQNFNDIVGSYDLFIGSGSSIIEAAALGVLCLAAPESTKESLTYGFLHQCYQYDFNLNDLSIPKYDIASILEKVYKMEDDEYAKYSLNESIAANNFLISKCSDSIHQSGEESTAIFPGLLYDLSRRVESILIQLGMKKNIYQTKYD